MHCPKDQSNFGVNLQKRRPNPVCSLCGLTCCNYADAIVTAALKYAAVLLTGVSRTSARDGVGKYLLEKGVNVGQCIVRQNTSLFQHTA